MSDTSITAMGGPVCACDEPRRRADDAVACVCCGLTFGGLSMYSACVSSFIFPSATSHSSMKPTLLVAEANT